MANKRNCPFCGGTRTLGSVENYLKCENCGKEYYISVRKKTVVFDKDTVKLIKKANKFRSKICYDSLKGLSVSERENVRDTMFYKNFVFRRGSAKWCLDYDDEDKKIYFYGVVTTGLDDDGNKINETIMGPTNLSIEEYKLVKKYDKKFDRQVRLSPIYPFNLFIPIQRMRNVDSSKKKQITVKIASKIKLDKLYAKAYLDSVTMSIDSDTFPNKDIDKLLKKANKEQGKGNLPGKTEFHRKIDRKVKGFYRRFVEKVHNKILKEVGINDRKNVHFIWYIENPTILRLIHSQFHHQGWRPTLLKLCLEEKTNRMNIDIIQRNPAGTTKICPRCLTISEKTDDENFICKQCGHIDNYVDVALENIYEGNKHVTCKQCKKKNVVTSEIDGNNIVGVDCQYCNSFIKIH